MRESVICMYTQRSMIVLCPQQLILIYRQLFSSAVTRGKVCEVTLQPAALRLIVVFVNRVGIAPCMLLRLAALCT